MKACSSSPPTQGMAVAGLVLSKCIELLPVPEIKPEILLQPVKPTKLPLEPYR